MSATPPASLQGKPCRWLVYLKDLPRGLSALSIAEVIAKSGREAEQTALNKPAAHLDGKTPREVGATVEKVNLVDGFEIPVVLKWIGSGGRKSG